jgi:periplasmic protein TonB
MKYQLQGFWFSLLIHSALLFVTLTMSHSIISFSKPIVIDFTIEDSVINRSIETSLVRKERIVKVREARPVPPKPVIERQESIPQKEAPPVVTAAEAVTEKQAPVVARPAAVDSRPAADSSSSGSDLEKTEGKTTSAYGPQHYSPGEMKQIYLKEHFTYIRNLVQKKLSYPKIARDMRWEGKVIIAFVVCMDGCAKDVVVKESSGIELLDRNAVLAVRNASPFPKPPIEAQLMIPINYFLN